MAEIRIEALARDAEGKTAWVALPAPSDGLAEAVGACLGSEGFDVDDVRAVGPLKSEIEGMAGYGSLETLNDLAWIVSGLDERGRDALAAAVRFCRVHGARLDASRLASLAAQAGDVPMRGWGPECAGLSSPGEKLGCMAVEGSDRELRFDASVLDRSDYRALGAALEGGPWYAYPGGYCSTNDGFPDPDRYSAADIGRIAAQREALGEKPALEISPAADGQASDPAWTRRCEAFKADPESLKAWYREKADALAAACSGVPCWGPAYCVDGQDGFAPAAEYERILPTGPERDLYFALQHAADVGGLGDLDFEEILSCCDDPAADAKLAEKIEAATEMSDVGHVELEPAFFEPARLEELAREQPGLFDDESCATWPELAAAKASAARKDKFAAAAKSSEVLDAERSESEGEKVRDRGLGGR